MSWHYLGGSINIWWWKRDGCLMGGIMQLHKAFLESLISSRMSGITWDDMGVTREHQSVPPWSDDFCASSDCKYLQKGSCQWLRSHWLEALENPCPLAVALQPQGGEGLGEGLSEVQQFLSLLLTAASWSILGWSWWQFQNIFSKNIWCCWCSSRSMNLITKLVATLNQHSSLFLEGSSGFFQGK